MIVTAVALWLVLAGIYGILTARNLICTTACLSVAQSGTYVFLLGLGYQHGALPPVAAPAIPPAAADPVMQALALTDVVVSAAVTALLLAMTVQIYRRTGTLDPEKLSAGSR